ncbi:MAG: DEAD/DEAH box helicase [Verrucomicrobiota bacterium]
MSAGPALQTFVIDPDATPLRLRLLLPPNLPQCAPRDRIPVKVEAWVDGEVLAPDRLKGGTYWAEPPYLFAALLLETWNGGRLPAMMQLSRDQMSQLLQPLTGEKAVFSYRSPKQAMEWVDGKLPEVHPHLTITKEPEPKEEEEIPKPRKGKAPPRPEDLGLARMVVDGSTHFLAITLPSRESSVYAEALELVQAHGFSLEPSNRKWWLRDRHKALQFLAEHWLRLRNHFRAKFTPSFRKRTKKLRELEARAIIQADGEDFYTEVELYAPGIDAQQIAQALNKGQPYLETHRGVFLFDSSKLKTVEEAQRRLTGQADRMLTPRARRRVSKEEAMAVGSDLEALDVKIEAPEVWQRRSNALKDLSLLEVPPVGEEIIKQLRPYQVLGAAWLWHLYRNKLGGILADEMGLGKTLQALILLTAVHEQTKQPCLVVCPAGLVENWRRECAKFTPDLKVFAHHREKRLEEGDQINDYGIIITSYSTLTRDAEMFETAEFAMVVGDEAQHVKNRQTQNAKTLRSLYAERRFLLTGTPVENSLEDLHSLFDFIMPGYLIDAPGGLTLQQREWHSKRLRERAAPYILRRSKQEVAPELPEKIEQVLYCEFDDDQEALYKKYEEDARREVFELEMSNASEGKLRMAAFQQLLKLRQLCIDPRLADKEGKDPVSSAKLEAFLELLEESLDGGHRLLVFSQFTSALALLKQELDARAVKYFYLDGQTPKRATLCEKFNNDESVPVFLISLKAGGTGLNLTGADTVVHYDPWWNPAVEAQATDRAHRIGQERKVTSYKLIVSNSVEERVLSMQRQKAALLKDLFEASEAANAKIKFADLKALLEEPE